MFVIRSMSANSHINVLPEILTSYTTAAFCHFATIEDNPIDRIRTCEWQFPILIEV